MDRQVGIQIDGLTHILHKHIFWGGGRGVYIFFSWWGGEYNKQTQINKWERDESLHDTDWKF